VGGLVRERIGPKGPIKLTGELAARIVALPGQGRSLRAIAAVTGVSTATVRVALGRVAPRPRVGATTGSKDREDLDGADADDDDTDDDMGHDDGTDDDDDPARAGELTADGFQGRHEPRLDRAPHVLDGRAGNHQPAGMLGSGTARTRDAALRSAVCQSAGRCSGPIAYSAYPTMSSRKPRQSDYPRAGARGALAGRIGAPLPAAAARLTPRVRASSGPNVGGTPVRARKTAETAETSDSAVSAVSAAASWPCDEAHDGAGVGQRRWVENGRGPGRAGPAVAALCWWLTGSATQQEARSLGSRSRCNTSQWD
jgi:hypothetical protein